MLLQQTVQNGLTFTIGWVDILILVILVVAFLRGRRLFFPILALVLMVYLFRIFPIFFLCLGLFLCGIFH